MITAIAFTSSFYNAHTFQFLEASRLGRQLSLPGPEETIESPKSAIINDPPQPVIPPIKDRSPTKNAESKVPHHVPQPRRKSIVSPAPTPTSVSTPTPVHTPSTPVRSPTPTHTPPEEVIETNTQPAADEVTTNLSPNNESPKRRFSTMSASHSFQVFLKSIVAHNEIVALIIIYQGKTCCAF